MPVRTDDFALAAERIGRGKYVSLTTYRQGGRAVATPVGCVVHDGTLYALTSPDTGKVKRIRNSGHVTVAPCAMNGTVADDAPVAGGAAKLLDALETRHVQELMKRKFFLYRLVLLSDRLLRRSRPLVGIAVTADSTPGKKLTASSSASELLRNLVPARVHTRCHGPRCGLGNGQSAWVRRCTHSLGREREVRSRRLAVRPRRGCPLHLPPSRLEHASALSWTSTSRNAVCGRTWTRRRPPNGTTTTNRHWDCRCPWTGTP
ncbi:PPOX class F420-dependent oxidoreductase [Streptomyces sp. NBC_00198]|uniref:PPOX class F420-dependent oxidoreductase n=1 Tax=Streptomyces sp. NBC_00198 TaxID=2975677 RepID=UPI0022514550|nr:PPOX class F420-dependent oxidoreductase [Streptomyces sp. NBC_00198]MCX5281044.1 PPOX class F420-dependent oxidoreductase [Streptomyces sp. NBC_00198]